ALEKFHDEAFALDKVKHKQIVQYHESFVEDHRAYLVLQYLEGKTLRQLIEEEGPLSPEDSLLFSTQMCEILSELHKLEPPLIHRDFTPDNLMVSPSRQLVLIDFAVAVSTSDSSDESAGKIAYMAPEQFKGSSTVQSDIYSCAATMFYVMTGSDPIPLSQSHPKHQMPQVPENIDALVAKATEQEQENRIRSISEMQEVLKQLA
ncbi:MAG: serine/threonine protein kinase, partial [Candidatus Obscuribacterales bacterium]|nr:serine/threonine protein kinase [Candidatus Obscuribacterales bacterium]